MLVENISTENNKTHINYDSKLEWSAVHNRKSNHEAIWCCEKCGKESLIHPNYIHAGIKACVGYGKCYETIDIAKQMLDLKGYIFIDIGSSQYDKTVVNFKCKNGHINSVQYSTLRRGGGSCLTCPKNKTKKELVIKIIRVECECRSVNRGYALKTRPKICKHYNYFVCCFEAVEEWHYEKNFPLLPNMIAPNYQKLVWWKCLNEWCLMLYEQTPSSRTSQGSRCPYCASQKICHWNNLEANYPELCEELNRNPDDKDSTIIDPKTIFPGYHLKLPWKCKTCGHKWNASPNNRVSNASGCAKCNRIGYDQIIGGHEYFVKEVRKIHGDKNQYPDPYKGCNVPIGIYCTFKNKNGIVHGIFMQTPSDHKRGRDCPKCARISNKSKYIIELQNVLDSLGYVMDVNCFEEHPFSGMVYKSQLYVDRYLNIDIENLAIESDGGYHFHINESMGGEQKLRISLQRDLAKDLYCLRNKINLFRVPYVFKITKEMIQKVIELCKTHKQVYISYQHFYDEVIKYVDLSNVYVLIMPHPNN
jgi:hypothetical protein